MPAQYRDTGAFVYDGQAVEARDGLDMASGAAAGGGGAGGAGHRVLARAQALYGRQDGPMESVVAARRAMAEAMAEHPEVRQAVEGDPIGKKRGTPSTASNDSEEAAQGGRRVRRCLCAARARRVRRGAETVLLTIERRDGKDGLGLLGGKAKPEDKNNSSATAAREAHEETHKLLSKATRDAIKQGHSMWGQAWDERVARVYARGGGGGRPEPDALWPTAPS